MAYRLRHLLNDGVQSSDDTTFSFELPKDGNLHTLLIRASMENGATSCRGVSILDAIDTIRIVGNGDERIYELTPQEVEKWIESEQGVALDMEQNETGGATQSVSFPIMFGNKAFDLEYFLPLHAIQNPRLEIVYSPPISATAGFATGTMTFNLLALWTPQQLGGNYIGTNVLRTLKNFTTAASGDEQTDIDISDKIKAIGIYAYEAGVADGSNITRLRLEANSGEYDIIRADWNDILEVNRYMSQGEIEHRFNVLVADTDTLDTRISDIKSLSIQPFQDVGITPNTFVVANVDTITGDRLTFNVSTADLSAGSEDLTAETTASNFFVNVSGVSPSYFAHLNFDYYGIEELILNPANFSQLRLILTQGNAGGNCRISLKYIKRFA